MLLINLINESIEFGAGGHMFDFSLCITCCCATLYLLKLVMENPKGPSYGLN